MIRAKKYDHLIGNLPGFSPRQIGQHLELYQGYVKKINEIRAELAKIPLAERKGKANFSYGAFSELKRRESVPYNGVYLHEMYFDSLGGTGRRAKKELSRAIESSFGSLAGWEQDLSACAEAATGGWVLLTRDRIDGRLHHTPIREHSDGVMLNQEHLMALDTWEHAFMIDFGTDKKSYIAAFLKCLDWDVIASRFAQAARQPAVL